MRIVIAAMALVSVSGCQKQEETRVSRQPVVVDLPPRDGSLTPAPIDLDRALARLPEATRRDLYCASVLDTMAQKSGISEAEVDRMAAASGLLAGAGERQLAAALLSSDDRVALFTLRDRVPDDIRRGEPKYPIADCLARADELKPTRQ